MNEKETVTITHCWLDVTDGSWCFQFSNGMRSEWYEGRYTPIESYKKVEDRRGFTKFDSDYADTFCVDLLPKILQVIA